MGSNFRGRFQTSKSVISYDTLPTPGSEWAGIFILIPGAGGVEDSVYCCVKAADDSYHWVETVAGGDATS